MLQFRNWDQLLKRATYCCTNTTGGTNRSTISEHWNPSKDGTYECPCLIGFTRLGPHSCTDIDECSLGTHSCDFNALCTNTDGSYTCDCPLGYDGLGYIKALGI